jgi:NTP pyrophosphatase (non-canonical NTP hydrolase)
MGNCQAWKKKQEDFTVKICGYSTISTDFPTPFPSNKITGLIPPLPVVPTDSSMTSLMPKTDTSRQRILLFPNANGETPNSESLRIGRGRSREHASQCQVVLSGSYRKDFEGLRTTYEELRDLGCDVLSPSNVTAVRETNGFVYMQGEEAQVPDAIENRHLDAIQRANFVWLHAPNGYVGPTASLEVGFAHAIGVPTYAREPIKYTVIKGFVEVLPSPSVAIKEAKNVLTKVPRPALSAFQNYYRRVAVQRGYKSESPRDCLLLMVEEVGELAREIRKRQRLVRHGDSSLSNENRELADIFLYVVHMANILDVDLAKVVQQKELVNLQRFLRA